MNSVDYALIHYRVAIKLWEGADYWTPLYPNYPDYCALRVDAESIAYDLAVAQACKEREDARLIAGAAWA